MANKKRRSRAQRKQRAAAARQQVGAQSKPQPPTPFGDFAKWMGRKPQWPKVTGLVLLLVVLAVARYWVVPAYFVVADKIVGNNTPMAVVLGWLPGGGAGVLIGIYVLYAPFLGYRGRAVWTVVNTVWAAFGLMMMGIGAQGGVHPAFDYGVSAGLATVPGLVVLGPLLIVVGIVLVGLAGLVSTKAKTAWANRDQKEQEHLAGWGVATAPLAFLAIALLAALS
ncbi:hypothetical protein [Allokutzneria oryzae]|uniref:Yip1 domain-containing protein n=1 Tax=Allokutzneria oryzae TaxID=1378989 RepID=A0ABV6A4C6_9PSEU